MSTNAPTYASATSAYASLYKGKDGTKGFGEALRRMVDEGREVSREEKSRWLVNRAFYLGDQWLAVNPSSGAVRTLAKTGQLRSGRRRDTVNRLRPFTDGRIALYANEKPAYQVVPPDHDQGSIDGAHQAERFIEAQWGENGWNIKSKFPELARAGEIDGIAFLYVNWNPTIGPIGNLPLPFTADGQPITDRMTLEALEQEGLVQWKSSGKPLGDVDFRIVRAGALSIDPFASAHFSDARWVVESRALPRDEVERMAGGQDLTKMLGESMNQMGQYTGGGNISFPDVNTDDGEGRAQGARLKDMIIVHEAHRKPGGDWPNGAHCIWMDKAPAAPLVAEPWQDELPYFAFMPKPHGGHFLRARGTVDDLKPVQIKLNRTYSSLGDWMDKMGNPPVMAAQGSIISNQIYGSPGDLVEYQQGFDQPQFFRAPSEPAVTMSNYIAQLENEMGEIANLPPSARGVSPGGGVESNIAIQNQQQQTEQLLSSSSAELTKAYEWGIGRALKLVGKYYVIPRMISAPGVSDAEEFAAFTGQMLHGASRFKITGSLQPASRAAEMQFIQVFAPILGDSIKPYVGSLIQGDTTGLTESLELDRQRQKRKNRKIAAIGGNQMAQQVWQNFQSDQQLFAQGISAAQQMQAMVPPPQPTQVPGMPLQPPAPPSPIDALKAQGINPPKLSDSMRSAGLDVPTVEWQDDPMVQLGALRDWALSDSFEKLPPMCKQLALELHNDLLAKTAEQLSAMAQQQPAQAQGSSPNPKGAPSPPRQPGQPVGAPPMRVPGG